MFKIKTFWRYSLILTCFTVFTFFTIIYFLTYSFEMKQAELDRPKKGEKTINAHRDGSSDFYHLTFYDSSLNLTIKDTKSYTRHRNADQVYASVSKDQMKKFFLKQTETPISTSVYNDVFIFSSVGILSPINKSLGGVVMNIWETQKFRNRPMFCCYLYEDGKIHKGQVSRKTLFLNNTLTAVQVLCKAEENNILKRQVGVTLVYGNDMCLPNVSIYVKVEHPKPCILDFCLAICAKIAYGYVNPEMIIEWLEYNRYMGVSHVVVFTYNLTSKSMDVLQFYQNQGFVQLLPFDFPAKNAPVHQIGSKEVASWTDEQLTVYDCHSRLSGYGFVGVIDIDEFLLPKQGTLQELMTHLVKTHPKAASFTFRTEIHAPEWGRENISNSLVPQYTKHTKALRDRIKAIHLPKYIEQGGIVTHGILPKQGYKRIHVLHQQAILKHYRPCRKEWIKEGTCFNRTLYRDTRMAEVFKNIDYKIATVKKKLGIQSK